MARYGNGSTATQNTTLTTLFTASTLHREFLYIAVQAAAQLFTEFTVESRVNREDDAWDTLASAALDYTAPGGSIFGASGDLTTADTTTTRGWIKIQLTADFEIRVRAKTAAADRVTWRFDTI